MNIEPTVTHDILMRLKRARGQLDGVINMITVAAPAKEQVLLKVTVAEMQRDAIRRELAGKAAPPRPMRPDDVTASTTACGPSCRAVRRPREAASSATR